MQITYFAAPQVKLFVFQLDIVQQNYISPENLKQPLCVTEVTGAAFDSGGTWLATAEYWNDGVMSPEIRLKFWQFNEKKQRYSAANTYFPLYLLLGETGYRVIRVFYREIIF